ncbi:MAG: ABC transporter permease [Gemmatimonadaceae bacterium]|nr:ABC transporter permease [Gemmatimonadaceae bacterium]NUQ94546.1 ABC transporter permease [Gemmatimonadaceae bacterium]NUR20583.1 ABC transporter permease [Gemmatimonadaceae bacterium]
MPLELSIAWRYLRSRRGSKLLSLISVIAIGGVTVGVSALIVIIAVMNGLQTDLREKILVASPDIRVLTFGDDMRMDKWRETLVRVKQQKGVVAAAPFVLTQAVISAGHDYREGVQIEGIEPERPGVANVTSIRQHALRGNDFKFRSSTGEIRGAVLGKLLAMRLNAFVGDKIVLLSAAGSQLNPVTGMPQAQVTQLEVTGLFETGMYEYDNSYVFLPLKVAQDVAGIGESVTGIEVKTADRWEASNIRKALEDTLGYPYRALDWQEQNQNLFQALKLEKLGMSVILLLIMMVAAFNIVSTLTMVVTDKTREIGILKAMGLRSGAIRRIFLAQGAVIGLVGTGLGLVIGVGLALLQAQYKFIKLDQTVYFIDHLPVSLQVGDVAFIVLMSLSIPILATWYPARQASRLFPVEAIRHE